MTKVLRHVLLRMTSEVLRLVELVALRRVAPRAAAQPLVYNAPLRFVPPALRAGSSQHDERYQSQTRLAAFLLLPFHRWNCGNLPNAFCFRRRWRKNSSGLMALRTIGPVLPSSRPTAPGRPRELIFKPTGTARGEFPGTRHLEQNHERGRLLHFFGNHELLATELMALVLLKFPGAPAVPQGRVRNT
jgi:hypothetical protein